MSGMIHTELSLFWYFIGVGAAAALQYDLILVLRRVVKHKTGAVYLEDLLFWLFWCVVVFFILYKENNGMMRWYVLVGILLGVYFWQKIIGRRIINFMSTFINRIIFSVFKKKRS